MKLTLNFVYEKTFKTFQLKYENIALKIESNIEPNKCGSLSKQLIALFPECYIYPPGLYNIDQFSQKINPILNGEIATNNKGEVKFFEEVLDNIKCCFNQGIVDAQEKHLSEIVENSIKLKKYCKQTGKRPKDPKKIPITDIINIDCTSEKKTWDQQLKQILLDNFSDVFTDSNMFFKNEDLTEENVYKFFAYILYKCLLDVQSSNIKIEHRLKKAQEDIKLVIKAKERSSFACTEKKQNSLHNSTPKIQVLTCMELKDKGMSLEQIAQQILKNDRILYGDIGNHSGSITQWKEHMFLNPEQWGFLCLGNNTIIGNFSCVYISNEQVEKIHSGTLMGNEITVDTVESSVNLAHNGEANLYLMNLSVNESFASADNWQLLFNSFGNFVRNEIKKGIMIRSIYTCIFRKEYFTLFERNGFNPLAKREEYGEFLQIDFERPLSERCHWFSFTERFNSNDFIFRKMTSEDLADKRLLKDISLLIHTTDPYIYEEGMMTREQAQIILPSMFSQSDSMFNISNIFLAISKKSKRALGVVLGKKGPLNWNSNNLKKVADFFGITLKESFETVENEYFSHYNQVPHNTISLINCTVNPNMKVLYGKSLENALLQAYISEHPHNDMLLYVLSETADQFDIYSYNGFKIKELCEGFTVNNKKLPSALLFRKGN